AAVKEGERIAQAVEAGELILTNLLGNTSRYNAALIARLLRPRPRGGCVGVAVVKKDGNVKYFPSITTRTW
ncbi:MAG: hypothetical protein ACLP9L_41770, partial [Thermoguttaceae bacterium]